MTAGQGAPKSIDEYISGFPGDVQRKLRQIRRAIRKVAPTAVATMSYGIPTYKLEGTLISFAAFKNHIGMYPAPAGGQRFNKRLATFRKAQSTVRFPLDSPLPLDLVEEIVGLRVKDVRRSAAARARRQGPRARAAPEHRRPRASRSRR